MRRQNPATIVFRADRQLRHELETAAKKHGLTLSQEIRIRLKGGLLINLIRRPNVKRANKIDTDVNS